MMLEGAEREEMLQPLASKWLQGEIRGIWRTSRGIGGYSRSLQGYTRMYRETKGCLVLSFHFSWGSLFLQAFALL